MITIEEVSKSIAELEEENAELKHRCDVLEARNAEYRERIDERWDNFCVGGIVGMAITFVVIWLFLL